MTGTVFWRNGELLPLAAGNIPIDDVNFAYGYGVYETLKVRGGKLYFSTLHTERLLHSAAIIGLDHGFPMTAIEQGLVDLVQANAEKDANLKVLMIGRTGPGADLYMMQLNPLFPKRHDYKHGARAVLVKGERQFPQAKSLNMLVSTLAFRQARELEAYDAVLVNRHGQLTEGTRTNLFYSDGLRFFTPPAEQVLAGVTRLTVMECIREQGWQLEEHPLALAEIKAEDSDGTGKAPTGLFLTSTSTKIMPISTVIDQGQETVLAIPENIFALMKAYDIWLDRYKETLPILVR